MTVYFEAGFLRNSPEHFESVLARLDPFLEKNGGDILGASKRVEAHAMIMTRAPRDFIGPSSPPRKAYVQIVGVDPELERTVLPFDEMLDAVEDEVVTFTGRDGSRHTELLEHRLPGTEAARREPFSFQRPGQPPASEPGIILGAWLARKLRVEVGDHVTVITAKIPEDEIETDQLDAINRRFIVTGCFQSGRYEYDSLVAFCEGSFLQKMLGLPNDCHEVRLRIRDPEQANELRRRILEHHGSEGPRLGVWTWEDQMGPLAEALQFEKLAMLIVLACIIAVAGACICGILYMVVLEKTRDIGILLSMGATSPGIVGIFLFYGGMLGLLGTLLGVLFGLEVVWNLDAIIRFLESLFNVRLFPPEIYEFQHMPTYYEAGDIVSLAVATFAWCLLASLLPALRAARLDPLKCLSYE